MVDLGAEDGFGFEGVVEVVEEEVGVDRGGGGEQQGEAVELLLLREVVDAVEDDAGLETAELQGEELVLLRL